MRCLISSLPLCLTLVLATTSIGAEKHVATEFLKQCEQTADSLAYAHQLQDKVSNVIYDDIIVRLKTGNFDSRAIAGRLYLIKRFHPFVLSRLNEADLNLFFLQLTLRLPPSELLDAVQYHKQCSSQLAEAMTALEFWLNADKKLRD